MVKVENSLGCPEPNGASVGRVWDRNALEEDERLARSGTGAAAGLTGWAGRRRCCC